MGSLTFEVMLRQEPDQLTRNLRVLIGSMVPSYPRYGVTAGRSDLRSSGVSQSMIKMEQLPLEVGVVQSFVKKGSSYPKRRNGTG